MLSIWHDLRYGLRMLGKNTDFTIVAILTLALGIGAATVIGSVVDSVLLNPFPYKNADRLATPSISFDAASPGSITRFPVPVFLDFKEQNHTFEDIAALAYFGVRYKGNGVPTQQLLGCWVTGNTFELLGIKPFLGRQITAQDGNPDSPPAFAMSDTTWANLFNRDPKILGASLNLNGVPRTLVAVMPPRFRFGGCEVWLPTDLKRSSFISGFGVQPNELLTIGRLKQNVSLQAASSDLSAIAKQSEKDYPAWFRANYRIVVNSLRDDSVGQFKATVLAMVAAVFILLLIACSNVANLLLARATVREKEIAIRASMGATRSRLIRQLLVESGLLAAASCIGGCLFAFLGLKGMIIAIPPDTIPPEVAISLRSGTLLLAVGVSVLATFVCGLAPALHLVRRDLHVGLAGSAKGASGGLQHGKLRFILVVEVALSIVLLTGTGLMVRTLRALERVDIGFNPASVAYARLSLPERRYDTADAKRAYFAKVLDRVAAIPGVIASTEATSFPPYSFGGSEIVVPGKTHSEPWSTTFDMCSEGYFQTLRRHLLRGRLLSRSDVELARHLTVINQTFERNYFGNEDPVGQRIRFTTFEQWATDWPKDAYFEIIGVIEDAKNTGLQDAPRPEVYFPHTITGTGPRGIIVRTAGNANMVLASLSRTISAVDSDVAISDLGTMENVLKTSYYAGPRFTLIILGTFGMTGLLLVVIGVFSVMAYTVSLQTHEIGIRMAVGAQRGDVLAMVLKRGLTLILAGTIVGLAASSAVMRLMASQIWGVSTMDPWTFSVVATLIVVVGLMASLFPARRATQVDPIVSLHYE
ncbi:MAG TPA: ABC transporter permease [Candidatus Sulfotelmatobacter sp.]|nr:ABC transporter permease [Candidatus Sulfotelmatobacter sp.]